MLPRFPGYKQLNDSIFQEQQAIYYLVDDFHLPRHSHSQRLGHVPVSYGSLCESLVLEPAATG